MTRFDTLQVAGWRQFDSVNIDFHPRATIITGANGAGKTTLLNILSQHFGWAQRFIGTPRIDRRGAQRYFSGVIDESEQPSVSIGKLTYANGIVATLQVPTEGETYQISIDNAQTVPGIYLTSHRPVYFYQKVSQIPTEVRAGTELFNQYLTNIRQFYTQSSRVESPSHRLKLHSSRLLPSAMGTAQSRETMKPLKLSRDLPQSSKRSYPQTLGSENSRSACQKWC